jgi:translin
VASIPDVGAIRDVLDRRFEGRETAITRGRAVVRSSANAIRALHRREWETADVELMKADAAWKEIAEAIDGEPALAHAGFVADSVKELAEAHITRALFRREALPGPDMLGIDPVPWLHGLGEAVGELRRRLLDLLRSGDLDEAESTMAEMDLIVDELAQLDYPDGMTHGLRRTTDVARALTERSRADLTLTAVQERLRRRLEDE